MSDDKIFNLISGREFAYPLYKIDIKIVIRALTVNKNTKDVYKTVSYYRVLYRNLNDWLKINNDIEQYDLICMFLRKMRDELNECLLFYHLNDKRYKRRLVSLVTTTHVLSQMLETAL